MNRKNVTRLAFLIVIFCFVLSTFVSLWSLRLMAELMQKKLEELERITKSWSGQYSDELSISCGYAASHEFPSENITELSRISDERMYAAKDAYYRRTGRNRREK